MSIHIAWLREHVTFEGEACLLWPFPTDQDGYGWFVRCGKVVKAHRWMCSAINGKPPSPKHHAAHSCGNGHLGCVHPKHLGWKTSAENAADRIAHGKTYSGKGRKLRKLSHEQVTEILALRGVTPCADLAKKYGVSGRHIRLIFQGKCWKDGLPRKTGNSEVHHDLIANR